MKKQLANKSTVVIVLMAMVIAVFSAALPEVQRVEAGNRLLPASESCKSITIVKKYSVCFDVRISNNYVQMGVKVPGKSYQWFNLLKATYSASVADSCTLVSWPVVSNVQLCLRNYRQVLSVTKGFTATGVLKLKYCLWGNSHCLLTSGWSFKIGK